jgi:phosphopantothenoylcysteine synthetase/decarboxylase
MNILVTAGNTLVPVDRVRCMTNVFTGRTGAGIALCAHGRGHAVTFLTSRPEAVADLGATPAALDERWRLCRYRTFDDLQEALSGCLSSGRFDVVIHCAAVSDYRAAGVYAPDPHTHFHAADGRWSSDGPQPPTLVDRAAAKVKSDEPELWLRLERAPKLIDSIRRDWGFAGILVKFKLEVGVSDERLLAIAEASRLHSQADLMVANTLEDTASWAFVGPLRGGYQKVSRRELAEQLLAAVEDLYIRRAVGEGAAHG